MQVCIQILPSMVRCVKTLCKTSVSYTEQHYTHRTSNIHLEIKFKLMQYLMDCQNVTMLIDSYVKHNSTMIHRALDKRGIEDNSKIIFLISQQKHVVTPH